MSGVGGVYEPMWMGQSQGQGRSAANEEDDFMDLGVPSGLPIRSSRSYDRSMSIPSEGSQGQLGATRSACANGGASGESPSLPPKLGRANSRQIKIQGFTRREPQPGTDIPPLPAPPSAARRFARSASHQQDSTTANTTLQRPQRLPHSQSVDGSAPNKGGVTSPQSRGRGGGGDGSSPGGFNRSVSSPNATAAAPTMPQVNGRVTSPMAAAEATTPGGAVGGGRTRRSLPAFNPEGGAVPEVSDDPFPMSPGYDL